VCPAMIRANPGQFLRGWKTTHASRCYWWPGTESNRRHGDFQSPALPTELPGHLPAEGDLTAAAEPRIKAATAAIVKPRQRCGHAQSFEPCALWPLMSAFRLRFPPTSAPSARRSAVCPSVPPPHSARPLAFALGRSPWAVRLGRSPGPFALGRSPWAIRVGPFALGCSSFAEPPERSSSRVLSTW
jgi:hypothetical protein